MSPPLRSREPARPSAAALGRQLERYGYSVHEVRVASEGDYAVADADWNYKDIPHLNVVHTQVRSFPGTIDDDHITSLNLQNVLGIPLPMAVVNYVDSDTSQTYFTTLGPFVLIVHTAYTALAPNRTRVDTTYRIGAKGPFRLLFPLLARMLKKNYATLMSEDLPMRDRRGALRERGFSFTTDVAPRGFPETADLPYVNVVTPSRDRTVVTIDADELRARGEALAGEGDDRGLRLVVDGGEIVAYPRICMHEGASLDCAERVSGKLSCPWHGLRVAPLLRVPFETGASAASGRYGVRVEPGVVVIAIEPTSSTSRELGETLLPAS